MNKTEQKKIMIHIIREFLTIYTIQSCIFIFGNTALTASGKPFKPSILDV